MTARTRTRMVYSIAEAAELLGIGRSTAYDLVSRGELPIVKIGGRSIVTRPTLAGLLGFEPPLPGELDDARRAPGAPTGAATGARPEAARRATPTAAATAPGPHPPRPIASDVTQPPLPFGA